MDELSLYQQIAEAVRQEIQAGRLKPGDRLPTVREMTTRWGCTTSTVLRAYHELARRGLVTSRVGSGTIVAGQSLLQEDHLMRRALLYNKAEAFLLEIMTSGYSPEDVQEAILTALDHWRAVRLEPEAPRPAELRFTGSHDPALAMIAAHYRDIAPQFQFQLTFTGSLGGLIALVEKSADLAGCHLWDEESDTYNRPYVLRLLPGRRTALLTLAHRQVGLIVASGNPSRLQDLTGLQKPGLRFVNRQPGSGTRVWLDAQLRKNKINPLQISGFTEELLTHSDVARAIARGVADAGLGVQSAAMTLGLDFIPLTTERYDLVIPEENWDLPSLRILRELLASAQAQAAIAHLGGYDTGQTGQVEWVG